MNHGMRFPTMWYVRPARAQTSLRVRAVRSEPLLVSYLEYSMRVKLLTGHHLEFLSLKVGYTCLSESTHVKMPHCWKSHVKAHMSSLMKLRNNLLKNPAKLRLLFSTMPYLWYPLCGKIRAVTCDFQQCGI